MRPLLVALLLLVPLLVAAPTHAHEIRPAYLEMRETRPDEFAVVWKVPAVGEMRLGLHARLPGSCVQTAEPAPSLEAGAFLERWTVGCAGGLKGGQIGVDGLEATMTDALVRIQYMTGDIEVARLLPEQPFFLEAGTRQDLK